MGVVTCDGPVLARALGNALSFLPARNSVPFAALTISPEGVYVAGSHDHIVVGTDSAPVLSSEGLSGPVTALIAPGTARDPSGLTELERAAREAKALTVILEIADGAVRLTPMGMDPVSAVDYAADPKQQVWAGQYEALFEMLDTVEKRVHSLPGVLTFGRGYFSKFDKVRTDSKDHALDICITDQDSPVFVRCGPTFRGMVAPVRRVVYAENVGTEGLW